MRGARSGYATARKYTRFTDPASHAPRHAKGATPVPAKKAGSGPEKTKPGKQIAAPKNAPGAAAKKTAAAPKGPAVKPGRALTVPGQPPKASPTMSPVAPGVTAVTEAVREHIGNFQPANVTDIIGFLAGLHELYSELGTALHTVSERLNDEEPIDASVTQNLQQMAGHTASLAEWGSQTEQLFRRAHEVELGRLENPRRNEEHWDVTHNQ
jgi:hypothetical protein